MNINTSWFSIPLVHGAGSMMIFRLPKYFVYFLGVFSLTLGSCAPEAIETPEPTETAPTAEAQSSIPTTTETPIEPEVTEPPVTTEVEQKTEANTEQPWQITHFSNENWNIAVVENQGSFTYYGCNLETPDDCIKLNSGQKACDTGDCIFEWEDAENNLYQLYQGQSQDQPSNQLLVSSNEGILADSDELVLSDRSQDLLPADREEVAGVTEENLKELLPTIQEAIFNQDWQAIADLSVDQVRVNYPDDAEKESGEIAKEELAALLAEADLDIWAMRVMTQNIEDLFLNQYGAMAGGGSIWMTTPINETTAQIYSINIW